MKHSFIIIIAFLIFYLPINVQADDFTIKMSSSPSPNEISIKIEFNFNQPKVIYHWRPANSIYPILNHGLFIECRKLESMQDISFMPFEKVLPKLPHELDMLKVKDYKEVLKIVPGKNYICSVLKKGKYSLKLMYDSESLRKYPGGKQLTSMKIESNELFIEIN